MDYFIRAKRLLAHDSSVLPNILHNMGNCFLQRFESHGAKADIDLAFEHHQQAVLLTPEETPGMAHRLNSLSLVLQQSYGILGDSKDLEQAVDYQKRAVELTKEGDPEMPGRLGNLGVVYETRFQQLGKPEDINDAIVTLSRAIALMPNSHPTAVSLLKNLADSYHFKYMHLGDVEDINNAIGSYKQVIAATQPGHPNLLGRLTRPGDSYATRYQRLGYDEDLNEAIEAQIRALQLISDSHSHRPQYLLAAAASYQMWFDSHAIVRDIDNSVDYLHQALTIASEGHPLMPSILNALGGAYFRRHRQIHKLEDLDESIKAHEQAVTLSTNSPVDLPQFLTNLGAVYTSRFDASGNQSDIVNALDCQLWALSLLPNHHNIKSILLANLGSTYGVRFRRSQQKTDINNTIDYLSKALLLTAESGVAKPGTLNDLAMSYLQRYEQQNQLDDLESAIKLQLSSISLTPKEHAIIPNLLNTLGSLYLKHHECQHSDLSLERALECFRDSAQHPTRDLYQKFGSAFFWARLSLSKCQPQNEQMDAHKNTMSLVPQMLLHKTAIDEQFSELHRVRDLAVAAAAVAIAANEYDQALEWLEQGRSVVLNNILQLQAPLNQLFSASPALASRLQELSEELHQAALKKESSLDQSLHSFVLERSAQRHRRMSEEYDQLVAQARQISGFERFLQLPKSSELIHAARSGPLVIVNVDQHRCNALVILSDHKTKLHIPLLNLTHVKVGAAYEKIKISLRHQDLRSRHILVGSALECSQEDDFAAVLAFLWRDMVKPILDALELRSRPGADELPHITWCTTGVLSFLPIHAAGDYQQTDTRLFNYAISSYTPTISNLLVTSYGPQVMPLKTGIIAVGQEHTLGHTALPSTKLELEAIKKHIRPPLGFEQLVDHKATTEAVLNKMAELDWVHLACHAHQDGHNPTLSGVFLHNGTLSLVDIAQRRLGNKGLAFLSACHTATGDETLPDEMAHLAAGMLTGGYRSVIATMWSIMDADAPMIADRVYGALHGCETPGLGRSRAARALHAAVVQLRHEVGEQTFSRWVPFIHVGA